MIITKTIISALLLLLSYSSFANEKQEYMQFIIYGQSLGMGWESPEAITKNSINGNYMIGNSSLMKHNNGIATLEPLIATKWNSGGEQPIVSCINSFSDRYRNLVNPNMKFIGMTGGDGGMTIEKLSKECTNGNLYESTFLKILDNTIVALKESNATITCPVIIYMQGEYNTNAQNASGKGLSPGTNGTTDKNEYKRLLLLLKENMQSDIMQKYNQTEKPLFFIYQSGGKYITTDEMNIPVAQHEFAEENDDVFMLNPHYALPDYNAGHLSTNGYRWFGEMASNIIFNTLVNNTPINTLKPKKIDISEESIIIDFNVPYPPLVFDTWTTPKTTNYGFCVFIDERPVNIVDKVEIIDETRVKITCIKKIKGLVEIMYAGKNTSNSGNLCDSYSYTTMYNYYDDSSNTKKETYTPCDENGIKIYGRSYPMQNWSIAFYKKIDLELNSSSIKNSPDSFFFNSQNNTINKFNSGEYIKMFSTSGILLISSKDNTIDISNFSKGTYIIQVGEKMTQIIKTK